METTTKETQVLAYSATTGQLLGLVVGEFRGDLLIQYAHKLMTTAPHTVVLR